MKLSKKGRIALAVSEGIVDTPYLDSVGVWTLGIGHTAFVGKPIPEANKGKVYSIAEIMDIFERDIKIFEDAVNDLVKVPLEQHEFDALVHFVYNIGAGGFRRSKLLKNLNAGNKKEAFRTGFHGWLKPKSLKGRRDKERDLALHGNYGSTVAPLYGVDNNFKPKRKGSIDLSASFDTQKPVQSVPEKVDTQVPEKAPASPEATPWVKNLISFVKFLIKFIRGR